MYWSFNIPHSLSFLIKVSAHDSSTVARVETVNLFTERGEEAKVVEQARAAIGKATGR